MIATDQPSKFQNLKRDKNEKKKVYKGILKEYLYETIISF